MKNKVVIIIGIISVILAAGIVLNFKKNKCPIANKLLPAGSLSATLVRGKDFENKGDLLNAKNTYQELINNFPGSKDIMNWQEKLEDLNIKLIFSSVITPKSTLYEIKPGDTIAKIAKEFKTTAGLIMKSNNISSDKIFVGRKIKVWNTPINIVVDKTQNILILKSDDEIIKTYIVSTGTNNSTPSGTFKIINKLENPTWFKAGLVVPFGSPENVLGTRWMGFNLAGYGIHGTVEPQNLGKQVTQGCVRMANSEAEELYTIVPVGTEVTIVD